MNRLFSNITLNNLLLIKSALDQFSEVIWLFDHQNQRFIYINQAFETKWGGNLKQLHEDPQSLFFNIHPEDKPQIQQTLITFLQPNSAKKYRIILPDRSVHWCGQGIIYLIKMDSSSLFLRNC
jgi:PAS domain-containing protein